MILYKFIINFRIKRLKKKMEKAYQRVFSINEKIKELDSRANAFEIEEKERNNIKSFIQMLKTRVLNHEEDIRNMEKKILELRIDLIERGI